jgi:hypothetical protein
MKFEIHFEFRASLRIFQDLNFWDATQETLKGSLRWAQNKFGLRIKKIRSDNGTEFKNSQIEGFLEDEYKTPDRFWAEAINTVCYSINRLYLHRILKKTSYELLTGKNPNVSYFRVFRSKCFILVKRGRKS